MSCIYWYFIHTASGILTLSILSYLIRSREDMGERDYPSCLQLAGPKLSDAPDNKAREADLSFNHKEKIGL